MDQFELQSDFTPAGDQPEAITELAQGLQEGLKEQVLLGVTGSGKTFTIANVVAQVNRPTLVLAHNKILAAQLYGEFKALFPNNAVEYFVSFYDYYQPEAYVPSTDTYIEKDTNINDDIDKMRHAATRAVLTRRDCLIVASVSCIYGIGSPDMYHQLRVPLEQGALLGHDRLIKSLVAIQYERNDIDFHRGSFRVRGDIVDIFPAYERDCAVRVEFFGDEIDNISEFDPLRGTTLRRLTRTEIFPGSHYATTKKKIELAIESIAIELEERLSELRASNQELYAQRLEQRTRYDLEMLRETGYCAGIENYSRHLDGRKPGEPPYTLINYFPDDFLLVTDESHMTIPQVGAMYKGDRSRKNKLVEYGFRLPCAVDNRPLQFSEFEDRTDQVIYVSATPAAYELDKSDGVVVEQVVRPTGILEAEVEVRPVGDQVDDLLEEVRQRAARGERILVTTLTKRMAEDLTDYYRDLGVRIRYMHADVDTLDRIELIRDLRQGSFDVLVGINLLREGLDLPEVSLVAILDADKEGFLRSQTSLVQTCGRAARNVQGKVIMYADKETGSMKRAIAEMDRRRTKQIEYNATHGITPQSIQKAIPDLLSGIERKSTKATARTAEDPAIYRDVAARDLGRHIKQLDEQMKKAAKDMDFERAAELRDALFALERRRLLEGL